MTFFQHYKSGVINGACGDQMDHGVLVVGYGATPSGQRYWKVKNSWGSAWGDAGYFLLARGAKKSAARPYGECSVLANAVEATGAPPACSTNRCPPPSAWGLIPSMRANSFPLWRAIRSGALA